MPWLTQNVFKQSPDEPLVQLPRFGDGLKNISFRHIVHAYRDHQLPQNTDVQAITFDSIKIASAYAGSKYKASCVAVTYAEDAVLIPTGMILAPPLKRSVGDVAEFKIYRHLPLLFDILQLAIASEVNGPEKVTIASRLLGLISNTKSNSKSGKDDDYEEYIVLTNSDIHLQPSFYVVVGELITQGYDVVTVNRRTLDVDVPDRKFTPLFLADRGTSHPGFDCFIFPRSMFDSFAPALSCCGAGNVMRSLLFNLVAHSRRFLMLTDAHLTYHLGDDKVWDSAELNDYIEFNIEQGRVVLAELSKDAIKRQRLMDFVTAHEASVFYPPWSAEEER